MSNPSWLCSNTTSRDSSSSFHGCWFVKQPSWIFVSSWWGMSVFLSLTFQLRVQNGNSDVMFYSSLIAFVCFIAFFLLTCVPLVNHSFVFKPVFSPHSLLARLWSPESVPLAPHVLSVVTVLHWFALCLVFVFYLPASVSCIWVHFHWSTCLIVKKYLSLFWRLEERCKAEFICCFPLGAAQQSANTTLSYHSRSGATLAFTWSRVSTRWI